MRQRFLAFLLAAVAAFSFMCSSAPEAEAVVNPAFIYSAMYSFLLSTGMQFNASSASESDVVDMMGDLYDDYLADTSSGLAVADYESGVTLTSLGQFAFNYAVVQPLQDFASWIASHFGLTSGATDFTPVVGSSSSNSYSDPNYPNSNYYNTENWSVVYASPGSAVITWENSSYNYSLEFTYSSGLGTFVLITDPTGPIGSRFYLVSSDTSSPPLVSGVQTSVKKSDGSTTTSNVSLNGLSIVQSKSDVSFYGGFYSSSRLGYTNFQSSCLTPFSGSIQSTGYNLSDIFTIITASPGIASGLAVKIGTEVIDRSSQVDDGESLIVDMGLSAGATITDAISGVSAGIADGTIATSVPVTSVVADAVIDTPVQPYPDVDSLGLPELGAALTSRFPFCIPWDFVDTVRLLSADPVAPNIHIDLFPSALKAKIGISGNTAFDFNLGTEQYSKIGVFCRWASLVSFIFFLVILTKRIVWTA